MLSLDEFDFYWQQLVRSYYA